MEAFERRVGWLGLAIGVVLVWANIAGGGFVGLRTWELIVVLTSLFCLAAAGVLLVAQWRPVAQRDSRSNGASSSPTGRSFCSYSHSC